MFEAVGKEYWNNFFSKIRDVLNPNGSVGLQLISIDDKIYEVYKKTRILYKNIFFQVECYPLLKYLQCCS